MADEVTLGELNRRIASLERDLKEDIGALVNSQSVFLDRLTDVTRNFGIATNTLEGVERRLRTIENIEVTRVAEKVVSNQARIASLESFNTWAVRTILGGLILGAIAFLFQISGAV